MGLRGSVFISPPAPPKKSPAEPPIVEARLDRRYLDRFQPEYPYGAKRRGEEGTVVVEVRIGPDGRVRDASVAESSGSRRLDQAAVQKHDAARQVRRILNRIGQHHDTPTRRHQPRLPFGPRRCNLSCL